MRLKFYLLDALRGLTTKPLRSVLSAMTVVLGVGALCLFLNLKAMVTTQLNETMKALGPDCFSAWVAHNKSIKPITLANVTELSGSFQDLQFFPYVDKYQEFRTSRGSFNSTLVGVSLQFLDSLAAPLESGSFVYGQDLPFGVWIGFSLAKKQNLHLGDTLWFENQGLTVLGTLNHVPYNPILNFDMNESAFVHIELIHDQHSLLDNFLVFFPQGELTSSKALFQTMVHKIYGNHTIHIRDAVLVAENMRQSIASFQEVFFWVASLSLVLGVFGIAIQQWVSFLERRGECGMRLSIGASRQDIFYLFLMESMLLGGLASIFGILLGLSGFFLLVNHLGWVSEVYFIETSVCFVASMIASGVTGLVPAWIASCSQPTKLLSYE